MGLHEKVDFMGDIKLAIRDAIESVGGSISDDLPFIDYANVISKLTPGGAEINKLKDKINELENQLNEKNELIDKIKEKVIEINGEDVA